jgi:hypothetical protein
MKMMVEESAQVGAAVGRVGDQFHSVAGGEDHALFDSGVSGEIAASVGQARFRDGEALADVKRSAFVIDADKLISHDASLIQCAS